MSCTASVDRKPVVGVKLEDVSIGKGCRLRVVSHPICEAIIQTINVVKWRLPPRCDGDANIFLAVVCYLLRQSCCNNR